MDSIVSSTLQYIDKKSDIENELPIFNWKWKKLNESHTLGSTSVRWTFNETDSSCGRWEGETKCNQEGDCFCATYADGLRLSVFGSDGLRLLVRGDGKRYQVGTVQ